MDYRAESGRRIRAARENKGWTLKDLADHTTNLSVSRISNYEQGLRQLYPDVAKRLAEALGVSAAYLMCLEEGTLSREEQVLLEKYRQTDERGKRTIQSVAEAQRLSEQLQQEKAG